MEPLAALYERYLELVYGVCLKYLENPDLAEDAVMDIFEQLARKLPSQQIQNFRPWLYVFTKNHCLMQLRRHLGHHLIEYEEQVMQSEVFWHPVEEEAEARAAELQHHYLKECLEGLSPNQQDCIRLFYLQDYTYREIADQCTLPLGTVRSHIQNGRRNLRNCMQAKVEKNDYE